MTFVVILWLLHATSPHASAQLLSVFKNYFQNIGKYNNILVKLSLRSVLRNIRNVIEWKKESICYKFY